MRELERGREGMKYCRRPISHKAIRYLVGPGPRSFVSFVRSLAHSRSIALLRNSLFRCQGRMDERPTDRQTHIKLSCRVPTPLPPPSGVEFPMFFPRFSPAHSAEAFRFAREGRPVYARLVRPAGPHSFFSLGFRPSGSGFPKKAYNFPG